MSVIHLNDDDLVLHYYGEMDGETEAGASAHLSACAACRERYAKLQRVLAAVETLPEAAVDEGFERMVWARLEPALDGRKNSGWSRWPTFSPVRLAWAAALVAVVASAFVAGRVWDRPGPEPAAAEASAKDLRERLLLVDLADHLDRSQMLLVDLASARTSGEIGSERARAQDLLASTRLYRQTAASAGDTALADLLDEMERVLVDVTAGAAAADPDASRQRVDSLLFKVRVVSSTLRERQKAAFRMRAGQSS
ncbi:MAG: hypothetical protein A3H96_04030 [Acidobacteria bacterium RIFCSPLOWO2_02_FULL_67_36]|nr:MAG: hypothetical protein A3H96_04030 [Acidobacteria bacterium RIFCSPLOWO2_02_FULL_67_36]OFW19681.1 MAG: hypothetical protein A3G21_12915 [Acidobacteria bacterium RIFCSPLOWO2_12_FULL_66_21]